MGKFYDSYKTLHEEVEGAVQCPKCETLKSKVDSISSTLQGLNLDWDDSVSGSFDTYISSCVSILTTVSSSIASDFASAEEAYASLKPLLDQLKKDDAEYDKLINNKPNETISSTRTLPDGTTETVTETSPEFIKWKERVKELEESCNMTIISIQPLVRVLSQVGGKSIAVELLSTGIQVSGTPTFTLPENIQTTSASTSGLEAQLTSISNDPSKCQKVVDLRPAIAQFGTTAVHTIMGWQTVTDKTSNQMKLRNAAYPEFSNHYKDCYDSQGFAKIGDRYVVATTTTYGNVGDYIDIEQEDGSVIKAIIGDIKNQSDAGCNKWGHQNGKCVVEFVVDCDKWYTSDWETAKRGQRKWNGKFTPVDLHPEWNQDIVEIRNLGNYFDSNSQNSVAV